MVTPSKTKSNTRDKERLAVLFSTDRLNFYSFDKTIWLYALVYVSCFVYDYVLGEITLIGIFELVVSLLALVVIGGMVFYSRNQALRSKRPFLKFHSGDYIILGVNIVALIGFSYLGYSRGATYPEMFAIFQTAMFENLLFGVIVANIVTFIVALFIQKKGLNKTVSSFIVITVSALVFGIAHFARYGLGSSEMWLVAVIGLVFVGTAWLGIPSIGITIHYINNLLVS